MIEMSEWEKIIVHYKHARFTIAFKTGMAPIIKATLRRGIISNQLALSHGTG